MSQLRRFTVGEEISNSISHGIAFFLSIAGLIILLVMGHKNGTTWNMVAYSIYGSTMILLFLSSTINHSLRFGARAKDIFHNIDQVAIYLFIAGTYTAIALTSLRGHGGWVIFGVEWGLAIAGLVVKFIIPNKFEQGVNLFYIASFVIMGWLLMFYIRPIIDEMSITALVLLLSGGACYTLGIIFYRVKKLPYSHLLWHLFVVGGSFLHWWAVFKYTL